MSTLGATVPSWLTHPAAPPRVPVRGRRPTFRSVDLAGAQFRDANLYRVVKRGVWVVDTQINGEIRDLTINGVDGGPLVEAELDRRYPERVLMRPTDPAGFRQAWDAVERLWGGTVERVRRLPPEKLHVSVEDEWSFIGVGAPAVRRTRPRDPGAARDTV